MCRVLGYLGPSLAIEELMTKPANSLVNQSFDAEYHHMLQLGGSGFASWEKGSPNEDRPLVYKSAQPAFFDRNLRAICQNIRTTCLLGHIRAVGYSERSSVNDDNCHPFLYPSLRLALAHNGGLPGWRDMLGDIIAASDATIVRNLTGSTDTEPLYCLLMSQFEDPTRDLSGEQIAAGLARFMRQIIAIKRRHDNRERAKLKFFMADGNDLIVANMGLDRDFASSVDREWEELRKAPLGSDAFSLAGVVEPVWFMLGNNYPSHSGSFAMDVAGAGQTASTVIVASEHLTEDSAAWQRIPLNHLARFHREDERCSVTLEPIPL